LAYGSKYVEADVPAPEDRSKRTWAELLEKVPEEDRPKLFVAPDATMALRKLYVERDALHAIATHLDLKWASAAVEKRDKKEAVADAGTNKDAESARAVRDEVVGDLVRAAASKLRKDGLDVKWARILARSVDRARGLEQQYFPALKITTDDVESWIGSASTEWLLAYLACNLLPTLVGSTWSGFETEAGELAKMCGLDLEEMVRAKLPKP
jgi:hypothetical protein